MPLDGFSVPNMSLHRFLIFTQWFSTFLPNILDTLKFVKERKVYKFKLKIF